MDFFLNKDGSPKWEHIVPIGAGVLISIVVVSIVLGIRYGPSPAQQSLDVYFPPEQKAPRLYLGSGSNSFEKDTLRNFRKAHRGPRITGMPVKPFFGTNPDTGKLMYFWQDPRMDVPKKDFLLRTISTSASP